VIVHDDVSATDLYLAMQRAGDRYAIHLRVCPARKAGRFCQACIDLELVADASEDRWIGEVS
jgi:hypothetical protein